MTEQAETQLAELLAEIDATTEKIMKAPATFGGIINNNLLQLITAADNNQQHDTAQIVFDLLNSYNRSLWDAQTVLITKLRELNRYNTERLNDHARTKRVDQLHQQERTTT